MEEQTLVLKLASHVGHPVAVAALAVVVAAIVFLFVLRAKGVVLASIAAAVIVALGIVPFGASTLAQSRAVYHVKVVVVRPDQSIVDIAQVKASTGGEAIRGDLKMVDGGWALDIPLQQRPASGEVTFSAIVKDEFMKGKTTLVLDRDYYPTATIQLEADTSAMVRGVVVDEDMVAVAGAQVSIEGNPEVAVSDDKGNFALPGHAGKGQKVEVVARKGQMTGRLSAPAGKVVEVILEQ